MAPVSTRALCMTVAHKPIGLEAEQHKHKGNYTFIHFGLTTDRIQKEICGVYFDVCFKRAFELIFVDK